MCLRIGSRNRHWWHDLGRFAAIIPDQARGLAIKAMSSLRKAIDPLAQKRERRPALIVRELAARCDDEPIAVHLKVSTATEYRRGRKLFIRLRSRSLRTAGCYRPIADY